MCYLDYDFGKQMCLIRQIAQSGIIWRNKLRCSVLICYWSVNVYLITVFSTYKDIHFHDDIVKVIILNHCYRIVRFNNIGYMCFYQLPVTIQMMACEGVFMILEEQI